MRNYISNEITTFHKKVQDIPTCSFNTGRNKRRMFQSMPLADEFRDPNNVPCSEVGLGPIRLCKERHQVGASIIMDTRCRQIMMRGYKGVGPTHLFK